MQDIRREVVSWLLAVVAFVLAVVFAIPGLGVSRTLPAGRRSVVAFLDPWWSVAFGVVAIVLAVALLRQVCVVAAHTLGVAVFAFWSAAVLIGSVMSDPPGPVTSAVFGVAVTLLHFWSVVDYADPD